MTGSSEAGAPVEPSRTVRAPRGFPRETRGCGAQSGVCDFRARTSRRTTWPSSVAVIFTSAQHERPSTSGSVTPTSNVEPLPVAATPDTEIRSERGAQETNEEITTTRNSRRTTPRAYDGTVDKFAGCA